MGPAPELKSQTLYVYALPCQALPKRGTKEDRGLRRVRTHKSRDVRVLLDTEPVASAQTIAGDEDGLAVAVLDVVSRAAKQGGPIRVRTVNMTTRAHRYLSRNERTAMVKRGLEVLKEIES